MANNAQVQFAGGVLRVPRHACAFIETRAQGYELTLPFIKDGFDLGDRAVHLVDSEFREDHLERLRSVGIDVEAAEESGRLELLNWNDTYVRNGRFDQDWMFSFIEQGINAAANIGARTGSSLIWSGQLTTRLGSKTLWNTSLALTTSGRR